MTEIDEKVAELIRLGAPAVAITRAVRLARKGDAEALDKCIAEFGGADNRRTKTTRKTKTTDDKEG